MDATIDLDLDLDIYVAAIASAGARLADVAAALQFHLDDHPAAWCVDIGDGPPRTRIGSDGEPAADCLVSGPASDMYVSLWNRRPGTGLTVSGSRAVFDLFRNTTQVRRG